MMVNICEILHQTLPCIRLYCLYISISINSKHISLRTDEARVAHPATVSKVSVHRHHTGLPSLIGRGTEKIFGAETYVQALPCIL